MNKLILIMLAVSIAPTLVAEERGGGQRGVDITTRKQTTSTRGTSDDAVVLPPVDAVMPSNLGLWREPNVSFTSVELVGNTVFTDAEIAAVTEKYIDTPVTTRELQELREALSQLYLERGYVNSGVLIPDQDLADSVLVLNAIEGSLDDIEVTDTTRLRDSYIAGRINAYTPSPLNVNELQQAIQLLQQNERVETLAAELVPGDERGEARLLVSVKEDDRWQAGIVVDNRRPESVGAEQATLILGHNNLLGFGDSLDISTSFSEGINSYGLTYSLPVSSRGSSIRTYYSYTDAVVLEEPFDQLDIESDTSTAGLAVNWSLVSNLKQELGLDLGFEVKQATTEVLGQPFSLGPGAIDGESNVSVVFLSVDWLRRTERHVFAFRSTLRNGIDALDATLLEDNVNAAVDADGEFLTWTNQIQYVYKLSNFARFNLRMLYQDANEPLMALEKLAIGGAQTVRGYRENFLVRDNGAVINLEMPFDIQLKRFGRIELMPFVDYGRSWDEEDTDVTSDVRNTDEARYIGSVGLSFLWDVGNGLRFNVVYGYDAADNFSEGEDPRENVTNKGLQDEGIHFLASYVRRF